MDSFLRISSHAVVGQISSFTNNISYRKANRYIEAAKLLQQVLVR